MVQNWQDILALGIVMLAVLYVAWRGLQMARGRKAGCGSCSGCSMKDQPTGPGQLPLVQLDGPRPAEASASGVGDN